MRARIRAGGVIAAGEGSRLRPGGLGVPKPLATVGGLPLIEHVLRRFEAAGLESAAVIFNESEGDCAAYVRSRPGIPVRVLVKTTASSLESFGEILRLLPSGRVLVSTVDAFLPDAEFLRFVRASGEAPEEATVLAVTSFVDDERPLWATLGEDGRIRALGGPSGNIGTAGLYAVPDSVRKLSPPPGLARLRDFLGWLVASGVPVTGVSLPEVIDVDRPGDLALAEEMLRRGAATR